MIKKPKTIADKFCKYFSEIGHTYSTNIPPPKRPFHDYLHHKTCNSFFMMPTDPIEISRIITSLKPKTSSGHDNISSKLLKYLIPSISVPLSIVINKSFQTGIVPKNMKVAKIIPIYKAKEKTIMGNYRPISLLPSASKILEKAVHHRLYDYCKNILFDDQYGFRPKHSTTDAIAKFTAHVYKAMENKMTTMSVFLDLSKAFDTIDHAILLKKLYYYGIRGIALEWFRNYLTDRSQFVSYKNTNSEYHGVTCGVPQGSVLGPLLFIIYTNDLPNALIYSHCILFADDTTVYHTANDLKTLRDNVEHDMTSLSDWFRANKLSLNVSKTNFLLFAHKPSPLTDQVTSIRMGNETIPRVDHAKFLGVFIDDQLQWGYHIDYISKKITSGVYAINAVKRYLSVENLKTLYFSFVHSYISYGAIIWSCAYQYKLHKLEILQKRAIRNICKVKYNEPSTPLFKYLQIPKLADIFNIQLCKYMFSYTTYGLADSQQPIFMTNSSIHSHNTRHHRDPHVFTRQTSCIARTFIHRAPKVWLNLPNTIANITSPSYFSYKVKNHFISLY